MKVKITKDCLYKQDFDKLNYEMFSENEIDLNKTIAEVLSKTYIESENQNHKNIDIKSNPCTSIP